MAARFCPGPDLQAEVARLRSQTAPDLAYPYQSGDTQLLAMALGRAVATPLAADVQQRLCQPMGAEFDGSWSPNSATNGMARACCCLNAPAVDSLQGGQLLGNNGRAACGSPLVPPDRLRLSTAMQERPGADAAARRNIQRKASHCQAFRACAVTRLRVCAFGRGRALPPDLARRMALLVLAPLRHRLAIAPFLARALPRAGGSSPRRAMPPSTSPSALPSNWKASPNSKASGTKALPEKRWPRPWHPARMKSVTPD